MSSTKLLCLAAAAILVLIDTGVVVDARKPSRPPPSRGGPPSGGRRGPPAAGGSRGSSGSSSRRRASPIDEYDEGEEEEDPFDNSNGGFESEDELEEDDEEDFAPPPSKKGRRGPPPSSSNNRKPSKARGPPPRSSKQRPPSNSRRPPPRDEYDDDYEEDDYDRPTRPAKRGGGSSRRGGPPPRGGRRGEVVAYGRGGRRPAKPSAAESAAATFNKGWSAFTNVMPDPGAVRDAAASSIGAARETASSLSGSLYRDIKGLTSSELEQVMLKATRPDDTPVKGKHVERLVGVTYQISPRYDIYDAVLRKLWKKMAESDWRTTIKALYILHRFSADGAPEHSQALKARLRELRRTKDPKRKEKFFNSKQMLAGDNKPENAKFRAFMARYSHYVLLRTQCFGGVFDEISQKPVVPSAKRDKKANSKNNKMKPITSTNLRVEHLEAAAMLLKAGVACQLKDGEDCENTAIAAERVASDMIGLTTAIAIALNRALKPDDLQGADPALIKRWCEFYSEDCLPKTRAMVKKTSSRLDAYGLFLPSRMGATVSPETLEKGLKAEASAPAPTADNDSSIAAADEEDEAVESKPKEVEPEEGDEEEAVEEKYEEEEEEAKEAIAGEVDGGDEYDEYEYEEEEYYDDEEA